MPESDLTTPTTLPVSLAEEIFNSLDAGPYLGNYDDCSGPQAARYEARRKEEIMNDLAQIIQRRVEPLERVLTLLANGSNPIGGLPYQSWVRHTARQALARIKDGSVCKD